LKKLGVSIYPSKSKLEEDKRYLDLAHKYGFTRIFTSLLEIEGDSKEVVDKYKQIIEYGNSLEMETMLDINPKLFGQLDVSYDDLSFFKSLGASGIRLDLGFSGAEEALMTKNSQGLQVEVNMSSGTKYIDTVMSYLPDRENLLASQNFYPQRYSGLSQEHFEKTTDQYNQYRLNTAAFITSQVGEQGPWPMQDGLCTLESHRALPIELQAAHYKMMDTIDDVLIGNAYASEDELRKVGEVLASPHHLIPVEFNDDATELERKVILEEVHTYRGDHSAYMIRSSQTRVKYKEEDFPVGKTAPMKKGDVVIGNDNFGQYKGETQVVIKDMEDDGNRNIVAKIKEEALFLLDYLEPWSSFKFVERT